MALRGPARQRPLARVCILINLLACPGLGTILARRRSGYIQTFLMVAGFVLVMGFMCLYLRSAWRLVQSQGEMDAEFHASYQPYLWALGVGLGLCAVAWVWALISSLTLWRTRTPEGHVAGP